MMEIKKLIVENKTEIEQYIQNINSFEVAKTIGISVQSITDDSKNDKLRKSIKSIILECVPLISDNLSYSADISEIEKQITTSINEALSSFYKKRPALLKALGKADISSDFNEDEKTEFKAILSQKLTKNMLYLNTQSLAKSINPNYEVLESGINTYLETNKKSEKAGAEMSGSKSLYMHTFGNTKLRETRFDVALTNQNTFLKKLEEMQAMQKAATFANEAYLYEKSKPAIVSVDSETSPENSTNQSDDDTNATKTSYLSKSFSSSNKIASLLHDYFLTQKLIEQQPQIFQAIYNQTSNDSELTTTGSAQLNAAFEKLSIENKLNVVKLAAKWGENVICDPEKEPKLSELFENKFALDFKNNPTLIQNPNVFYNSIDSQIRNNILYKALSKDAGDNSRDAAYAKGKTYTSLIKDFVPAAVANFNESFLGLARFTKRHTQIDGNPFLRNDINEKKKLANDVVEEFTKIGSSSVLSNDSAVLTEQSDKVWNPKIISAMQVYADNVLQAYLDQGGICKTSMQDLKSYTDSDNNTLYNVIRAELANKLYEISENKNLALTTHTIEKLAKSLNTTVDDFLAKQKSAALDTTKSGKFGGGIFDEAIKILNAEYLSKNLISRKEIDSHTTAKLYNNPKLVSAISAIDNEAAAKFAQKQLAFIISEYAVYDANPSHVTRAIHIRDADVAKIAKELEISMAAYNMCEDIKQTFKQQIESIEKNITAINKDGASGKLDKNFRDITLKTLKAQKTNLEKLVALDDTTLALELAKKDIVFSRGSSVDLAYVNRIKNGTININPLKGGGGIASSWSITANKAFGALKKFVGYADQSSQIGETKYLFMKGSMAYNRLKEANMQALINHGKVSNNTISLGWGSIGDMSSQYADVPGAPSTLLNMVAGLTTDQQLTAMRLASGEYNRVDYNKASDSGKKMGTFFDFWTAIPSLFVQGVSEFTKRTLNPDITSAMLILGTNKLKQEIIDIENATAPQGPKKIGSRSVSQSANSSFSSDKTKEYAYFMTDKNSDIMKLANTISSSVVGKDAAAIATHNKSLNIDSKYLFDIVYTTLSKEKDYDKLCKYGAVKDLIKNKISAITEEDLKFAKSIPDAIKEGIEDFRTTHQEAIDADIKASKRFTTTATKIATDVMEGVNNIGKSGFAMLSKAYHTATSLTTKNSSIEK